MSFSVFNFLPKGILMKQSQLFFSLFISLISVHLFHAMDESAAKQERIVVVRNRAADCEYQMDQSLFADFPLVQFSKNESTDQMLIVRPTVQMNDGAVDLFVRLLEAYDGVRSLNSSVKHNILNRVLKDKKGANYRAKFYGPGYNANIASICDQANQWGMSDIKDACCDYLASQHSSDNADKDIFWAKLPRKSASVQSVRQSFHGYLEFQIDGKPYKCYFDPYGFGRITNDFIRRKMVVDWVKPMHNNSFLAFKVSGSKSGLVLAHVESQEYSFLVEPEFDIAIGDVHKHLVDRIETVIELPDFRFAVHFSKGSIVIYKNFFPGSDGIDLLRSFEIPTDAKVTSLCVVGKKAVLAVSFSDGRIALIDTHDPQFQPQLFKACDSSIDKIWSLSDKLLAIAYEKTIRVWNIAESSFVQLDCDKKVKELFAISENLLAVCTDDNALQLWDKETGVLTDYWTEYRFVSALSGNRFVMKSSSDVQIYDAGLQYFVPMSRMINADSFLAIVADCYVISQENGLLKATFISELASPGALEKLQEIKIMQSLPITKELFPAQPLSALQRMQEFVAEHRLMIAGAGVTGVGIGAALLWNWLNK